MGNAGQRPDELSDWENEGGSGTASSILQRGKAATAGLAAVTVQQARRAKLARDSRRLEARLNANIDQLGHEVFRLFETGKLECDDPGVVRQLRSISHAQAELRRTRATVAALASSESAKRASMKNTDDNTAEDSSRSQAASDATAEATGQPADVGGQG